MLRLTVLLRRRECTLDGNRDRPDRPGPAIASHKAELDCLLRDHLSGRHSHTITSRGRVRLWRQFQRQSLPVGKNDTAIGCELHPQNIQIVHPTAVLLLEPHRGGVEPQMSLDLSRAGRTNVGLDLHREPQLGALDLAGKNLGRRQRSAILFHWGVGRRCSRAGNAFPTQGALPAL